MSLTRPPRALRILIARRRLFGSVLAGVIAFAVLPLSLRLPTRLLIAWDLTAALYVALALWMIARASVDTCRRRAMLYDEGDWVIMMLMVSSAAASYVLFGANTICSNPLPKSGRFTRSPGDVNRSCSIIWRM